MLRAVTELGGGGGDHIDVSLGVDLNAHVPAEMLPAALFVARARRLDASDGLGGRGKADPFVKVFWRSAVGAPWIDAAVQTKVVKANLNPTWDEALDFEVEKGARPLRKLFSASRPGPACVTCPDSSNSPA